MAVHVRDDVAIIQTGESIMLLISGDEAMARDIRGVVADVLNGVLPSPSEESRQRLEDLHASLNLTLGKVARRPRRSRVKEKPQPLRVVCMIPDCGCSGYAHA